MMTRNRSCRSTAIIMALFLWRDDHLGVFGFQSSCSTIITLSSSLRMQQQPKTTTTTTTIAEVAVRPRLYQSTRAAQEESLSMSTTSTTCQPSDPVPAAIHHTIATTTTPSVPTTMSEALRVFFLSGDYGPSIIVLLLLGMAQWRLSMAAAAATAIQHPLTGMDAAAFAGAVVVWWFQEYFLHDQVLHSKIDWVGKAIHQGHHDKPYYHVSIDPAALLVGWMAVAHFVLWRWWLPLPLAVSATLGYSAAGLFYEWAHYIVHTKVRFQKGAGGWGGRFWIRVRDNHVRHHRINSDYWFAFSVPWMDDLLQSNPNVQDVQSNKKRNE